MADDTPPLGPLETKDLPAGFTPGNLPASVPAADFTASAHPSSDQAAKSAGGEPADDAPAEQDDEPVEPVAEEGKSAATAPKRATTAKK